MQNRYIGDIGDYGKYALLRALAKSDPNERSIKLAVVWCLYPDETHNSDGKHVSYLAKEEYRKLDPELHEKLNQLLGTDRRTVADIASQQILPSDTIYFERPTRDTSMPMSPARRVTYREDWLRECLSLTCGSDLVFFDPDNGLAPASITKSNLKAGKYVFLDELRLVAERGQSLILYHHLNRTASANAQVAALNRVLQGLGSDFKTFPLLYRRGSSRVFCTLASKPLAELIARQIDDMLERGWRGHFELRVAS